MDKYTWNLEAIYENDNLWERDLKSLNEDIDNFSKTSINFIKSGKTLYETITTYYNLERKTLKIYKYAKLMSDADGLSNKATKMVMRAEKLFEDFGTKTIFFDNEIKKINNGLLSKLLKEEPKLETYNYFFKKVLKNKKHILSSREEEILAKSSFIREGYETIFSKIDAVDVTFKKVFGKELNHSTYSVFLKDKNQKLRKTAYLNYHNYYKEHANSIGMCLINSLKNDSFVANVRKYKDPLNMALDGDNIKPKVYNDLIKSVHDNLNLLEKYLLLKAKACHIDKPHMYDLYLMSANYNRKFTFDEGFNTALKSVEVLGKEYSDIYKKALTERWIDVYYRKGKYSGAYSSGSYDTYPYLLLNYNDTFRAVETLSHEMGHSMHSYYAKANNPYHTGHYPIFLAEIASNVGELLLFDYMLKNSDDKEEQKYILEIILDSFKGSIFRQTQFAEYEKIIHEKVQSDESLSPKDLTDIYYELNKTYYGNNIVSDDIIRYEALRIPHFYSAFYVYKYATGLAIAYVFAGRIINHEKNAVENYLKFLKIGGTNYPLEVLKECDINFSNKVIDEAMETFKTYLNKYEELVKGE